MEYLGFNENKMLNGFWSTEFHKIKDIPESKIKITQELKIKILNSTIPLKFKDINLDFNKTYDIGDFDNLFEEYKIDIPIIANRQDKFNADLLKQNAQLLTEINAQKQLNSQILLELAKLKGGNTNV